MNHIKLLLTNKWFKMIALTLFSIVALFFAFVHWIMTFAPSEDERNALKLTVANQLTYLDQTITECRGKILAVVTSADKMGTTNKKTGYELTELSRAYWVFKANGFEVDIASPKGGHPPVVIDGDDMGQYDYAFLNDQEAKQKIKNTLKVDEVNPDHYEAVYFVGGKGAMFDFPDNESLIHIVKSMYQDGKVISAVCHGPAALVNVKLDDGRYLVANKKIASFTDEEELFLIPDAQTVFPFLLESKLTERGANFKAGYTYLENVVWDGKVITGQNPWSVWTLAENVVAELGYVPKARVMTGEENSMDMLVAYESNGYEAAKNLIEEGKEYKPLLLLMHGIVAGMKFDIDKAFDMASLARKTAN